MTYLTLRKPVGPSRRGGKSFQTVFFSILLTGFDQGVDIMGRGGALGPFPKFGFDQGEWKTSNDFMALWWKERTTISISKGWFAALSGGAAPQAGVDRLCRVTARRGPGPKTKPARGPDPAAPGRSGTDGKDNDDRAVSGLGIRSGGDGGPVARVRARIRGAGDRTPGPGHRRRVNRKDSAAAILFAAERATWMALVAIQALGGNGYVNDNPAGRLLRDAKLYEIGAGTSEIRRLLIGRELFEVTA